MPTPHHPIIVAVLLAAAVGVCLASAVGVAVGRTAYDRLQYATPVAALAVALMAVAVWVGEPDWQARIKATLVAAVLFVANAVLSHATAKAVAVRDAGRWPPDREGPP